MMANIEVTFFESLEGLEVRLNRQCLAVLKDYRRFLQMAMRSTRFDIPSRLYFDPRI